MILNNFIGFAFDCINFLCWAVGNYFVFSVKVENKEDVVGKSDNESYQWKNLKVNEIISFSSDSSPNLRHRCGQNCASRK